MQITVSNKNIYIEIPQPSKPNNSGTTSIVLAPDDARSMALSLLRMAGEADGFPGSDESGEFFIDFDTEIDPGKLQRSGIVRPPPVCGTDQILQGE